MRAAGNSKTSKNARTKSNRLKHRLLGSSRLPQVKTNGVFNILNGNDSEILSASQLIIALKAEVKWGSRNEDNSKIDLLLSFEHPWTSNRIFVLSQVKTGYEKQIKVDEEGYFIVGGNVIKNIKRTINTILFTWVQRNTGKCYWANIYSTTPQKKIKFGQNHLLSPATRYELTIKFNWANQIHRHGKGVRLKNGLFSANITSARNECRKIYKSLNSINNPIFGEISLTRLGWNHMFRKSRSLKFKKASMELVPNLGIILRQAPDKYWINNFIVYQMNSYCFWHYEYVLKYFNVKDQSAKRIEIVIKIIEEIAFPVNWLIDPFLSQKVKRIVTFKSCSKK